LADHLSRDIERFVGGTLSRQRRREVLIHLQRGCPICCRALAQYGNFTLDEAPKDAYDAVVSRAMAKVLGISAARQEALGILNSLLSGGRSWSDLSASEMATLRGLPQLRALLDAGRSLRHDDPLATLRFARLARYAADRLDTKEFGPEPVADLRALAWAELANAYRICDDLPRASRAINRAVYWSRRGSHSTLLLARVADLLASFMSNQRRFNDGRELLNLVYQLHVAEGRPHLAGRALISAGLLTAVAGAPEKALPLMHRGLELLEPDRDPVLVAHTLQTMIWFLTDLRRFRTARRLLWRSRALLVEHGNALILLRLRWLEGRIYAGLSDFARAEAAFQETRAGFAEYGQVYPAALAGLDLAALWARQGRVSEIQALAQEMIATFRALRIAREAIVTLLILQRACAAGGGQLLEIIEMVVSFLRDLEQQPAKRYESGSRSPST
jgi:tetratricopeptide (TPR) repeat protein